MDVAVNPECWLFACGTGPRIGGGQYPDVAAFVTLSNRFDGQELGVLACERVQKLGQFGVAVETVESDGRHGKRRYGQSSRVSAHGAQSVKVDSCARSGLELCDAVIGRTMSTQGE